MSADLFHSALRCEGRKLVFTAVIWVVAILLLVCAWRQSAKGVLR